MSLYQSFLICFWGHFQSQLLGTLRVFETFLCRCHFTICDFSFKWVKKWENQHYWQRSFIRRASTTMYMMKRHLSWLWYNGIISNGTRLFIFCGTFMSWQNPVMDHKRIFNLYPFNFFFSCSFVQVGTMLYTSYMSVSK